MDANYTQKKTLAVAFAALLVGSLFVAGFASAHEEAGTTRLAVSDLGDPSSSANAVLHWDYDCEDDDDLDDCDDNADTDFYVDVPSGGEIFYTRTYDLFFVAIPADVTGDDVADLAEDDDVTIYFESWDNDDDPGTFGAAGFDGIAGSDIVIDTETLEVDRDEDHCDLHGGVYDTDDDECTPGVFALVFEAVNFEYGAGTYYLVRTEGGDDTMIGVFEVTELNELDVVLDPARFTYIFEEEPEVDVVVTNDGDGVEGISLESEDDMLLEAGEDDTSSSGRASLDFDTAHPPAGRWTIIARQDVSVLDGAETAAGADIEDEEEFDETTIAGEPDLRGEAILVIDSNTLEVEDDSTAVLAGFRQTASWTITFPEEDEDEDCLGDDEEGFNVVFPGVDPDEGEDAECTNGLLYGLREFEVANVSVRAPNGDTYFLNMTYDDWAAGVVDMPMYFCVDAEDDEEEDECDDFGTGDDNWDSPLLLSLGEDGTLIITPNMDFEHPLEVVEPDWDAADPGPLSEDNRVWLSGSYNITVDVSTSGRGLIEGSYDLGDVGDNGGDEQDAADFPEYTSSWTLSVAEPADLNLELAVAPFATLDIDDATQTDSIDVLALDGDIPVQTLFITIYGETIDDHPLCAADVWREADDDDMDLDPAVACADADENDELGDDETLAEAEEDFLDQVSVSGDLLPDYEITSYDAVSGVLVISGVTPTQAGNITVTVEHDGDNATLRIPVENGARIELDVDEIVVGIETEVIATIRDQFGGLVTTADLALVLDDGTLPGGDFDMSPSSGEISGTGASGRGLGGEYRYVLTPDTTQDLIVYAIVGEGSSDETYAYALLPVAPAHDLEVELVGNDSAMASVTTPVILDITPGWDDEDEEFDIEEISIWFIHEDGLATFEDEGGESLLDLEADDEAFEFDDLDFTDETAYLNVTLPPGNYSILVCDTDCTGTDATHDNAEDMPSYTVERFRVTFTPAQIANAADIEENVRISVRVVDADGRPANGILESVASTDEDFEDETEGEFEGGEDATITAVITNGFGNFTGVTGGAIGNVAFTFNPSGSSTDPEASLVQGVLRIVGPNITVTPSSVRIGAVTLVTIEVNDFDGDGLAGRIIRLCAPGVNDFPTDEDEIEDFEDEDFTFDDGDLEDMDFDERFEEACPTTGTTGGDGVTTIAVNPTSTTPYRVYVNGTYSGTDIPVVIGTLAITLNPTAPAAGQNVTVTATLTGVTSGSNAGVNIRVVRDGTQVLSQATDTNGRVTIPGSSITTGNYTVTATRTGFGAATATFQVGAQAVENETGARFVLRNLVLPSTIAVGSPVNVSVDVENTGDENGTATANLFVNGRQTDTRTVTLNASDEETLTYNFTPTVAGTYAIMVRIGDVTIGPQNITVGTPSTTPTNTTSPVTSPVTTSPVTTPVTSPVTTPVTSTPATTPEPTVPGFEVVALLAALGIAMLVLRRRN